MTPTEGTVLDEWDKDVGGISAEPMTREDLVAKARSDFGRPICPTLVDGIFALEEVKDIREIRSALQWS